MTDDCHDLQNSTRNVRKVCSAVRQEGSLDDHVSRSHNQRASPNSWAGFYRWAIMAYHVLLQAQFFQLGSIRDWSINPVFPSNDEMEDLSIGKIMLQVVVYEASPEIVRSRVIEFLAWSDYSLVMRSYAPRLLLVPRFTSTANSDSMTAFVLLRSGE